ncbi:MAG: hypothetical protein NTZ35_18080 [Ignavibacteriales bacterium]|nr:hypothetical protein [Ignavibacteriales bacterium]
MIRRLNLLFLVATFVVPLSAQVQFTGDASASALKSARTTSARVVDVGNPTFGWRFDLFLDGKVTDNVSVIVRTRTSDDELINFDCVALRITNLANLGFNFQMGKFDIPFGNLAERRYPSKNFLYGLPLIHEYRMSLPNQVPTRVEVLNNRGKGTGMRLLDLGINDLGAMVFGDAGKLHYAVAVANGTVSSTTTNHQNEDSDFNKILRLAYTPMTGLTVGASAAMSAYLGGDGRSLPRSQGRSHYQQMTGELDVEFNREKFMMNGEAVYSRWTVPFENQDTDLWALGYNAEAKYTWIPRFYTAVRVGGLVFSRLSLESASPRWDNNILEVEAGVGYYIDRNTLAKLVRRETRTLEVTGPRDNLTVLQLAVSF